jgi:hypothetical protein
MSIAVDDNDKAVIAFAYQIVNIRETHVFRTFRNALAHHFADQHISTSAAL